MRVSVIGFGPGSTFGNEWGLAESSGVYTGCQSAGKPISDRGSGAVRKPDS
jgi:hypothetical protein